MLVQIDGSRHAWLGERGPWLTLNAAIDDATGKLIAGIFREHEDAYGYFLLVRQMLQRYGWPLALYHDRHSIFQQTSLATEADTLKEQLAGKQDPTQFGRRYGRIGDHLDCGAVATSQRARGAPVWDRCLIASSSNCAKLEPPRVSKPMRSCRPICRAQSAQFAVEPAQAELVYRPLPETRCLDTIVCFKYVRTVALDNSVNFGEHRLQLLPEKPRRSYARAEVEVHERLDGSLAVYYAGRCLVTTPAPLEAPELRTRHGRRAPGRTVSRIQTPQGERAGVAAPKTERSGSVPGPDHPWRKPLLKPKQTPTRSQVS